MAPAQAPAAHLITGGLRESTPFRGDRTRRFGHPGGRLRIEGPEFGEGHKLGRRRPEQHLKYKEEYKKMLGKDGQLLWKPSESKKRPPGIPKS